MPSPIRPLLIAAAALSALAATPAVEAKRTPTVQIKTAQNATLGKRILTTAGGRTLYTLSAETDGRFICTGSCLSTWPPLILKNGAKAVGVARLGSIKRPDGRRQATYKGRPLYRFASDRAKGDVGGEGFVDVGTWHAARAPRR
jgi:predicted lipoprotein with Yx(FWY)xxD motif